MYSRLLRIVLGCAALGWGVSILAVILPWPLVASGLSGLGAEAVPDDPMLIYWSRMAGGGFTLVGAVFAALMLDPGKYAVILPLMAWLSVGMGVILLYSGLALGLPPLPFLADSGFCLGVGVALLVLRPLAAREGCFNNR